MSRTLGAIMDSNHREQKDVSTCHDQTNVHCSVRRGVAVTKSIRDARHAATNLPAVVAAVCKRAKPGVIAGQYKNLISFLASS